ncbi:MAG: peptidoglycan DD-metalloendopeptidase family protein [Dehalococcoidia bacterium]|nr:peptidoglycan DD-metalloendopeptidase family protein [Dehalococcoidia bacterium]
MAVVSAIGGGVQNISHSAVLSASQGPVAESKAAYLKPPVLLSTVSSLVARQQAEVEATEVPTAPAPAAAAAAPESTPEPQPAYFAYTIQPGDSVYSIADNFGIDAQYILWNNPDVREDPDLLVIGANLLVPSVNGLVYNVRLGDTLSDVASYYQIDVQNVSAFAANNLSSPDDVIEGMVLVLPGAVPPPPPVAPQPVDTAAPDPGPVYGGDPVAVPVGNPGPPSSTGYLWPFYGGISTYFSGWHRGIDIDGFGSYGAPIAAAADGQVVLAAWDDYGYGYHVIVQHADGSETLYGHLSEIWVEQGQYVGQGQAVGALGSTGYSTGPHLHFELHIGGVPVDPLQYLP